MINSMTKMRIAKDKKTGRSRGFAYLDFDSKATAETAVAALAGFLHNTCFMGCYPTFYAYLMRIEKGRERNKY